MVRDGPCPIRYRYPRGPAGHQCLERIGGRSQKVCLFVHIYVHTYVDVYFVGVSLKVGVFSSACVLEDGGCI